ncbi:MAG: DUF3859 domain-containing protein [Leptospiraceae bacterium]|nr:DUF3859 domain-containing protein [Leptospiraceae bacterium]
MSFSQCKSSAANNVNNRSLDDSISDYVSLKSSGVYKAQSGSTIASPGVASGQITDIYNIQLLKTTQDVQPKVGDVFGFQFVFDHKSATTEAAADYTVPDSLQIRVEHPAMTNPKDGVALTSSQWQTPVRSGKAVWVGWYFEHDWEIVAGKWTFQVYDGDTVLVTRSFTISKVQ